MYQNNETAAMHVELYNKFASFVSFAEHTLFDIMQRSYTEAPYKTEFTLLAE